MNKVKSYCDSCIHKEVCGKEGCGDPAMVFCDDRITETIPVEWIKEFANVRAANDGMDCYWHFWSEDVLQMIDQWRKENE